MPLLYYWRPDNYFRDLDMGAGYHLNQANPLLHKIEIGDSLWGFTRNKDKSCIIRIRCKLYQCIIRGRGYPVIEFAPGFNDIKVKRFPDAGNKIV